MDKERAKHLLEKYLDNRCTPEERAMVEQWYNQEIDRTEPAEPVENLDQIGRELFERIRPTKKKMFFSYYPYAAAVMMLIGFSVFFFYHKKNVAVKQAKLIEQALSPGGNKAVLTLGNGEKISLTDAQNGNINNNEGLKITKTEDGQIQYIAGTDEQESEKISYNTISTPKGGQFQVRLADGTDIWLNSESSITYPSSFKNQEKREVILKGEAYFEVAHNKEQPFIVHTQSANNNLDQQIEVLGTHFNINSYENESFVKTTLLSGSVRVKSKVKEVILKPNQQSTLLAEGMKIKNIDPEEAVAWKSGYFMFEDEGIASIMRKIARWYDIEVEIRNSKQNQKFTGTISKFEHVSKVLSKLELTGGVHFNLKGRRVIVD